MAEVVLFHHAQGLTAGVRAFADELRSAGHTVHTPDLYDGRTFDELDDGMAYGREVGFETILERGRAAGEALPAEIVYAGMSLGGMSAQALAQTRPGAKGCLLLHTAIPLDEFGGVWPDGVPLQIHTMEEDDYGDADVARDLDEAIDSAEVFIYPGDTHLFTDNSLSDYDEAAATLVNQRVLAFLDELE
jgi:dienelactone hydrolase